MNKKQKLFAGFLVVFLIVFMSASCVQDLITPAFLDQDVIAINGGYTSINPFYTSLFDATRLRRQIVNKFKYSVDALDYSISNSMEIKGVVFDSTGPLAMMFPALMGLGLGRYMKSPREQALEKKVNGNNKTTT
jgi:hypothetical protein